MKRLAVVAVAVLVAMASGMTTARAADEAAGAAVKKQTLCPIIGGGKINPNCYLDANGKRVYFCCSGCKPEFLKDPAKYIAQMEKDGITLDVAPAADASKQAAGAGKACGCGKEGGCGKESCATKKEGCKAGSCDKKEGAAPAKQ